jgi:hypothetical protein
MTHSAGIIEVAITHRIFWVSGRGVGSIVGRNGALDQRMMVATIDQLVRSGTGRNRRGVHDIDLMLNTRTSQVVVMIHFVDWNGVRRRWGSSKDIMRQRISGKRRPEE